MKNNFAAHFKTAAFTFAAVYCLTGCSKKESQTAVPPPAATAATPVANTPAPVIKASTDAKQSFAEADAALKQKAYDTAAQAILAAQMQKNLTDQQAQEARNRMIGLQQSLAAAVAAGDQRAIAAANMIRQAHMVH
jgi:uncharacterized lipoprotein YajG